MMCNSCSAVDESLVVLNTTCICACVCSIVHANRDKHELQYVSSDVAKVWYT